jgi:hypothetical protein
MIVFPAAVPAWAASRFAAAAAALVASAACFASPVRAETVSGRVVGPDNKPVAGAQLLLRTYAPAKDGGPPSFPLKVVSTGADGVFSADLTPFPQQDETGATVYGFATVSAAGYALAGETRLKGGGADANTVRLEKGVTVRGTVRTPDGKPAAGVPVRLASVYLGGPQGHGSSYLWVPGGESSKLAPEMAARYRVTAGADGSWAIGGIPMKAVSASVVLADDRYVQEEARIPLAGEGAAAAKPLVARPAAVITGRVVGRDGSPRPGVGVSARQENYGPGMASAQTGADGSYRLAGLPGSVVSVWTWTDGGGGLTEVAAPLRGLKIEEGKATAVPDLVLSPGALVEGTVTDAVDNKPLAGAWVAVQDDIGVSTATRGSLSDAKGRFTLRLPPGDFRVSVLGTPKGYLSGRQAGRGGGDTSQAVKVAEGETKQVTFRLPRALTLAGVAVDAAGKPVVGAKLVVVEQGMPETATTDAAGRFTLTGLSPGKVRLAAASDHEVVYPKGDDDEGWEAPAPEPIRVTLRPFAAAPVTGRVVSTTGKPVPGVTIRVSTRMRMGGSGLWIGSSEARTGDDGRFTLPPVRPENGQVELEFVRPGFTFASGGVVARAGDRFAVSNAVMRPLDAGRTVRGRVLDAADKPVAGALVAAPGAESGSEARTDARGVFTLAGVPEGDDGRILAARGASFGAASVAASAAAVTVRLRPIPGPTAAAATHDASRAAAVLRAVQERARRSPGDDPEGDGAAWHAARYAPELAVSLLRTKAGQDVAGQGAPDDRDLVHLIRQTAEHNPARLADWAVPRLKTVGDPERRRDAAYAVVIAPRGGTVAASLVGPLYEEMRKVRVPDDEWGATRHYARLAVLAARLQRPDEAQKWMRDLIAVAEEKSGRASGVLASAAAEVAPGGAALVRALLSRVKADDRGDASMRATARVARYSALGALSLLEEMEKDPAITGARDHYNRGRAALEVVRELAKSDPSTAARVAGRVEYRDFRAAAWALAAHGQPSASAAAPLYARAASAAMGSPDVLTEVAALALDNDPKTAARLFADVKRHIEQLPAENDYRDSVIVRFANRYARVAPGEARLMLEAVRARSEARPATWDEHGIYRSQLALAMRAFDPSLALAWSESVPEKQKNGSYDMRNATQIKIALWLLADPPARRAQPLSDHDQYGFVASDY